MEELEDRRHEAINNLFKPTYIRTRSIYGICGQDYPIEQLNYFEYQYYLNEGQEEVIRSYEKEEYICKQFLENKIGFTELMLSIKNFYTLQTILINLESEYQRRVIYGK